MWFQIHFSRFFDKSAYILSPSITGTLLGGVQGRTYPKIYRREREERKERIKTWRP
jgi:hypothetical protein